MADSRGPVFVGVDGGGTKTRAVVVDARLTILGRGEGGPSNGATQPMARVEKSLADAMAGALAEAGCQLSEAVGFGFGLAGIEAAETRVRVAESLGSMVGSQRYVLTTDGRAALAGAAGDPARGAGVILMAGTGAIAFGRNEKGEEARASGMGWIIGDEGSGYWMARRGLEAVAREIDGRGPATAIRGLLRAKHGVESGGDLVGLVYKSGPLPAGVAAFFPLLLEAARAGDRVANGIVGEAAAELALAVETVVKKLGLTNATFPVAASGGVLAPDGLLLPLVTAAIAKFAMGARIGPPEHPPEVGAARLAIARSQEKEGR